MRRLDSVKVRQKQLFFPLAVSLAVLIFASCAKSSADNPVAANVAKHNQAGEMQQLRTVKGRVLGVAESYPAQVSMKNKTGELGFHLYNETTITRSGEPASANDLGNGQRVRVILAEDNITAQSVDILPWWELW